MTSNGHVRFGGVGRGDWPSVTTAQRPAPTRLIELSTRKVRVAGVTTHPDSAWVTQQARNTCIRRSDALAPA
jgi:hypothetical protein